VRVAIDHLRSQRRRPVTVEVVDNQVASLSVTSAVRAEVADALRNLSTLSPEQRVAFVLREVMDYSFPEIAQLVGCFTTTARMRVAAAKRTLARRSR
jgi:RNA polymerase sigma-70 factor (ECF subfamily)